MKREIVALKGFDDNSLGGRVKKGATFEVSQQVGDQLVRNGLVAFTSTLPIPPPPVGNGPAAGPDALSSASPAAPASRSTATVTSTSFAPGDSPKKKPTAEHQERVKKRPAE